MEYSALNFYICRTDCSNIMHKNRIDNVRFADLDSTQSMDSNNLVICSNQPINTSIEYTCLLLCGFDQVEIMPNLLYPGIGGRLSDSVCRSVNDLPRYYLNQAQRIFDFIEPPVSGSLIAFCLTYSYDLCLLIPNQSMNPVFLSEIIFNRFESLTNHCRKYYSLDSASDQKQLKSWYDRIMRRCRSQNIYRSNPNFREHLTIIKEFLDADVKNSDEAAEYSLVAALLLHSMLIETRWRWADGSGELHYEETAFTDFLESVSRVKIKDLQLFIDQSSPNSQWHDLIWSIIFITRGILATILRRDESLIPSSRLNKHRYLKERNNFYGFLPIVSKRHQEISSYYHEHMSPKYNIGFLAIPHRCTHSLWSFFPAYIHELYHYIAPSNRNKRNEVVLDLTIHTVLNPLYTYLRSAGRDVTRKYNGIHHFIFASSKVLSNVFETHDIDNSNDIDSMYYILKMQCLRSFDFEKSYDKAVSIYLRDDNSNELNNIRQKCIIRWREDISSYLRTFVVALREIRSDISMYHFLWKDAIGDKKALARYIAILASEPGFAKTNATLTADSVILRFGFMTRYLVRQIYKDADDIKLYRLWIDNVKDIIDLLRLDKDRGCSNFASSAELEYMTDEKLDNLLHYISEYTKIALIKTESNGNRKIYSIFERCLYYKMSTNKSDGSDKSDDLVPVWECDVSEVVNGTFPRELRSIYLKYEHASICGRYKEMLCMDYNSRLIFRRLFLYFKNIDL